MTRLIAHVEGQTEELFVNEVLAPYLYANGYSSVSARIIGNARLRSRRGGIKPWGVVKSDIARHLASDGESYATTMVDYYALPAESGKAWPGRAEATSLIHSQKADHIEKRLTEDLLNSSTDHTVAHRFIPYIAIHEFEALLFSDCTGFANALGMPELSPKLQSIRDSFGTPEEINDSPVTAPSKRVESIFSRYEKPLYGNIAALEIGIEKMKNECPHFANWIERLLKVTA